MPKVPVGVGVAESVGVLGWRHLDPILLAALALQAPLLLVGEHGTAKTHLVEQLADALDADFRHYNAALLNYDDLVGIPLPDDHGGLRFVGTQGAIWGAEFVFFDEVNRCRPDLQNKLFPIVHERRVGGVALPDLQHRWAAMNPPDSDDPLAGYLGTEILDLALADRFWFVVRVPGWKDLTRNERVALATGDSNGNSNSNDRTTIAGLVADIAGRLPGAEAELAPFIAEYVVTLIEILRPAGVTLSPRRVRLLVRAIIAVHTAAAVAGREMSLRDAAELALCNALAQFAEPTPPSLAQIVGAHVQAWEVSAGAHDETRRAILEEGNLVKRVRLGVDLAVDETTLALLVTSALAGQPHNAQRAGLAVVFSRALAEHDLTPAAWGLINTHATPVIRPATHTTQTRPGTGLDAWREASLWFNAVEQDTFPTIDLERALVTACGPELLDGVSFNKFIAEFCRQCELFGVTS